MVDYCISVDCNPPRRFPSIYRNDRPKIAAESPLNLSLRDTERTFLTSVVTSQENGFQSHVTSSVGELGNVLIVSDLNCDIAQEEVVVETVCEEIQDDAVTDDTENTPVDPEEEYAAAIARNAFLRSAHERLSEKVAKMRQLLDSAAKRQKLRPETETEVRSESDLESSDQTIAHAFKRSRNNSWPQMSTITSNQRKKEQNKLASKRFRERKKLELARAQRDIEELEARNTLLRCKADSMQTEADNLKKILLELCLIKVVDLPTGQSTIVKNI